MELLGGGWQRRRIQSKSWARRLLVARREGRELRRRQGMLLKVYGYSVGRLGRAFEGIRRVLEDGVGGMEVLQLGQRLLIQGAVGRVVDRVDGGV